MFSADARDSFQPEGLGGLDPPMTRKYGVRLIDQHRVGEAESPDRLRDLLQLFFGMGSGVARLGAEIAGGEVFDGIGHLGSFSVSKLYSPTLPFLFGHRRFAGLMTKKNISRTFCFTRPRMQHLSRLHFHWTSLHIRALLWPSPGASRARSGTGVRHSARPRRPESDDDKDTAPTNRKAKICSNCSPPDQSSPAARSPCKTRRGVADRDDATHRLAGAYSARGLDRAAQDRRDPQQPPRGRGYNLCHRPGGIGAHIRWRGIARRRSG